MEKTREDLLHEQNMLSVEMDDLEQILIDMAMKGTVNTNPELYYGLSLSMDECQKRLWEIDKILEKMPGED